MRTLGISCNSNLLLENTEEKLRTIKEAGFGAMFTGYRSSRSEEIAFFAEKMREFGISYDFLHGPFDKINDIWSEGEEGEKMYLRLLKCAESCKNNEIPLMVIHLSSRDDAPFANDVGTARFDRLMEETGKLGVKVAIENQRKIGNISYLMERYANLDHVGFCWDNGHEAIFTPDIEFMPIFGKKLFCVHIHDNHRVRGEDLHYLPFDGEIDFVRVAELIRQSGFTGTLMLETKGVLSPLYSGLGFEGFHQRAYRRADRLRKMIDGE